jgi:phosphoglycolate phosphatase
MKKKLVIFDLDGTLLNTIEDLATGANYALAVLGYPTHDAATIRSFVGNGINKLLERALPEGEKTEENILRMRSVFIPYYDEHNADLTVPYEGVPELLVRLQNDGVQLAVASNKYQAATEKLVAHFFPNINFIKVLGQRSEVPIKPDPAIVIDILQVAGVSKDAVLYVGDSGVDMLTALNAQVDAVGVTWGFRPKLELSTFPSLGLIDKAEELLNYV